MSELPLVFPSGYQVHSDMDFQTQSFELQLVLPMISSIHVPNYPMEPANQLGCSQNKSNCTFNLKPEWSTSEDLQP